MLQHMPGICVIIKVRFPGRLLGLGMQKGSTEPREPMDSGSSPSFQVGVGGVIVGRGLWE